MKLHLYTLLIGAVFALFCACTSDDSSVERDEKPLAIVEESLRVADSPATLVPVVAADTGVADVPKGDTVVHVRPYGPPAVGLVHATSDSVFLSPFMEMWSVPVLMLGTDLRPGVGWPQLAAVPRQRVYENRGDVVAWLAPEAAARLLRADYPRQVQLHTMEGRNLGEASIAAFAEWDNELESWLGVVYQSETVSSTMPNLLAVSDPDGALEPLTGVRASGQIPASVQALFPPLDSSQAQHPGWQGSVFALPSGDSAAAVSRSHTEGFYISVLATKAVGGAWEVRLRMVDEFVLSRAKVLPYRWRGQPIFYVMLAMPDTDAAGYSTYYYNGQRYVDSYDGWLR